MFVWSGGPFGALPSIFTSLLGWTPAGIDAAGPEGAVGVGGCDWEDGRSLRGPDGGPGSDGWFSLP
jgi:hypothetical protein